MKIVRLSLIAVLCAVLLTLQLSPAFAILHRGGTPNNARVTINVESQYLNLAKAMPWFVAATNCSSPPCANSDGYPNQKPTSSISITPSLPAGYYGTLTWSWSGTGSMQDNSSYPIIFTSISPQGAVFEMGNVSSGDHAPSGFCYCSQSLTAGLSNPSIQFQYGWNIQSIDSDAGVIRINTKTNYVTSKCWGQSGPDGKGNTGDLVFISGANSNTGANGLWVQTNCTASSFDLVGSTFTNGQASAGGTAIVSGGVTTPLSYNINSNSNTWTGFSNLVIAKTADIAAINAGHYWDATYVSQLQAAMNPNANCAIYRDCGWLRFMDFSGTEQNWEKDYSERRLTTAISFSAFSWYPLDYWVGQITNTSDTLAATDPTVSTWNGSSYIDGALVQGFVSATNTTPAPTLNVGGHGAKPILDNAGFFAPDLLVISGVPATPGTDTMTFTFGAGGAAWFNGGSNCVVTYTTQANDTTISQLATNLTTWFGGGTVGSNTPVTCLSSSSVRTGNQSSHPEFFPPTAQAGRFTVSYSSVADPSIVTPGTMATSYIVSGAGNRVTFRYNYLLDAWSYVSGEPVFSPPMEVAADLANQVGANVWWNFNFNSSGYVQSVVQNFAVNLNVGLKFGFEQGNENWDCFGPRPCHEYQTFGNALGISSSSNASNYSWAGLQEAQYVALAKSAWTGAGRSASDFYVFSMTQAANEGANGPWDTAQLQGHYIATTNTCATKNNFVATYGALGGGALSTDFACAPNRPVDITTAIGIAPYWGSPWFGSTASALIGTTAGNAAWLQAQLDYANGLTSQAFTEIANTFNGTTARTDGHTANQLMLNAGVGSSNIRTMMTSMEAIAAEYDSYRSGAGLAPLKRFDYEGAPQWGFGTNANQGTNSASDAASLTALANQFTSLGWNVSAYTLDGQNTPSELAQQLLTFTQAWKNSPSYANMIDTTYYQALSAVNSGREAHGAQYGWDANIWSVYPGDFHFGNPYQNYNAIATQNAGN